jgi:hypothetical protein
LHCTYNHPPNPLNTVFVTTLIPFFALDISSSSWKCTLNCEVAPDDTVTVMTSVAVGTASMYVVIASVPDDIIAIIGVVLAALVSGAVIAASPVGSLGAGNVVTIMYVYPGIS